MSQGFDPFDPQEWGDKPGCSAFEVALEMRGRGALAAGAVPVLEAHLAACDDCRDHAARLGRVDASLVATAAAPDVRRLRKKMDDELKESRRTPWMIGGIAFVGIAGMLVLFGRATAQHRGLLVFTLLVLLLTAGVGVLASHMRVLRLHRLLAEPDSVGAYRRWAESNLKAARSLPLAMVMNALVIALPMRSNMERYAAGDARAGVYVALGFLAIVFLALVCIISWRRTRRLKAELAELH